MLSTWSLAVLALFAFIHGAAFPSQSPPPAASQPSQPAPDAAVALAAAKARFRAQLDGVQLRGSWQVTAIEPGAAPRGPATQPVALTEPKPDTYTILSANEAEDDWWVIEARIQYNEVDVTLPIRLRVLFAGDTPVLTVDNVGIPGSGPYSARVLVYDGFYAGTWSGPACGGVLSGQIVKQPAAESAGTAR